MYARRGARITYLFMDYSRGKRGQYAKNDTCEMENELKVLDFLQNLRNLKYNITHIIFFDIRSVLVIIL